MIEFVNKYGSNVHSQSGEDGVIQECVKRIPITNKVCVEVGGNDGLWLSNTRLLIDQGWCGRFIESDYNLYLKSKANWAHNPKVTCQCSRVDGKNVNAFVDDSCDVFSSDTDGVDYEIFSGLKAKPKIVIVEIDSSFPPDVEGVNSDGGVSYRLMVELGLTKGYQLICHTGNLLFCDKVYKNLFPEIAGVHPLVEAEKYFNRSWLREKVT